VRAAVCGIAARDKKKSPGEPHRARASASLAARGGRPRAAAQPGRRYTRTILPLQSRDLGVIGSKRAMMAATDAEMKARNGPADARRARTHFYSNKMDLRRTPLLAFVYKLFIFIKFVCVGCMMRRVEINAINIIARVCGMELGAWADWLYAERQKHRPRIQF
jgi:hypothetical protein